jgi:putative membrane protein
MVGVMSEGRFFEDEAKERVKAAVAAIESKSAAEIVVTVRPRSWRYTHTHYLFGFVVALGVLGALLFLPQSFDIDFWLLEITVAFVSGTALCMALPSLERWLTSKRVRAAQVGRAAKEAFVDLGVTKTRDRSGLLVYVSLAERTAALVPDVGLEAATSKGALEKASEAIERAASRADLEDFIAALEQLTEPLAKALPRREDDVNELPDEVV